MKKLSKAVYYVNNTISSAQQLTGHLNAAFGAALILQKKFPGESTTAEPELLNKHEEFVARAQECITGLQESFHAYEQSDQKNDEALQDTLENINRFYQNSLNMMTHLHNALVDVNSTGRARQEAMRLELTTEATPAVHLTGEGPGKFTFTKQLLPGLVEMLDLHMNNIFETIEQCVIVPQADKLKEMDISVSRLGRKKYVVQTHGNMFKMILDGDRMAGISTEPDAGLTHELEIIRRATHTHKQQAEEVEETLTHIANELQKTRNPTVTDRENN